NLAVGDTGEEICRLEAARPSEFVPVGDWLPGQPFYATITIQSRPPLLRAIERTMGQLPNKGQVFVEVAVQMPFGEALAAHSRSPVRFGLPAEFGGPILRIVKIANWNDGIPANWR